MAKQTIGEFLATQRKAKGFTQQYVADLLGVSNKTLSAWETNKAYPDILVLPALAELYGVTADEILNGERRVNEQTAEENFSEKSRDKLYKSKLARNSAKNVILICVGILAAVMVLIGWLAFFADVEIWACTLILILGLVATVVVFILLAFFAKNTIYTCEGTNNFIINVIDRCLRTLAIIAAVWIGCGVISIIFCIYFVFLSQADEVAFVFFEAILFIGLLMLLVEIAVRAYAFRRYGTEEQNLSARYNLKLFSYCCVSVIPCLIISVLLIVSSEINIFVPIEFLLSYLILASYILFAVAAIVYRVKHKKIIVTL